MHQIWVKMKKEFNFDDNILETLFNKLKAERLPFAHPSE